MLPMWADVTYNTERGLSQGSGEIGVVGIVLAVGGVLVLLYSVLRK